jgi:hypothetical protein
MSSVVNGTNSCPVANTNTNTNTNTDTKGLSSTAAL